MNVIVFGASGMIGQGVLLECLDAPDVSHVLSIGRSRTGISHPKLEEVTHSDFLELSVLAGRLAGYDACFYCLGVSSAGMSEADYTRVTHDFAVAVAAALLRESPAIVLCFVSGAGTDATEKGRSMWARVKGRTENALLGMPFRAAYMFRPGVIQPLRGIRSKTALYRGLYAVMGPFFPLLLRVLPGAVTTTELVGRAMLEVARSGSPERVLRTPAINALGKRAMPA
jgi:uncharacterized protein YbjT (DUF2867 family)